MKYLINAALFSTNVGGVVFAIMSAAEAHGWVRFALSHVAGMSATAVFGLGVWFTKAYARDVR